MRRIIIGDRIAWEGTAVPNQTILIDKPDLFGGTEGSSAQGGVGGYVDIEFGGSSQLPNEYVQAQVGSPIPAYRGKVSMTFRGAPGGRSFYWTAMNPYIKPVAVTLSRIMGGWSGQTITDGTEYSNSVLYPWLEGTNDPRACENDHEYRYASGSWRSTLEAAIDDAETALGASLSPILIGWSKDFTTAGLRLVSPYTELDPEERESLYLHFNRHTDLIDPARFFATLSPGGGDVCGAFPASGISPGDGYFWWQYQLTSGIPPTAFNTATISGVFGHSIRYTGDIFDPVRLPGLDFSNNCTGNGPPPGDAAPNAWVVVDELIEVRRKVRAPDEPCLPRCDDPYPDYELDSSYCVIDEAAVKRGPWSLTAGSYKALAIYATSGSPSEVTQYPLNPVLPSGHASYDDEDYWTAAYDAAVDAGSVASGLDYGVDYPVVLAAAYTRDGGSIVVGEVWYPEVAAIECKGTLLRTEYIDLDAVTNASSSGAGAAAVGVLLEDVEPGHRVEVTANPDGPYVAYSPWGVPSPVAFHQGSVYLFNVIEDGVTGGTTTYGPSGSHDGYAAARTAMQAIEPIELSGASSYLFYISDTPIMDNTGGLSLKVDIYQPDYPDMNPAHIIYQCLTEPDFGIGLPAAFIDDDSFRAAALQLKEEEFGLSFIWLRQEPVENFINIVIEHISAALYQDRTDGKFRLKLIRDDYDIEDLQTFDESNLVEIQSFGRVGWGETVNEVVVGYTNPANEKESTVSVQNLANIQLQGGVVTSKRSYAGIRCAPLAYRVAQRDLKTGSTPLAAVKLIANRSAWTIPPGGVFKLSWAEYAIESVVFRVTGIDYGSVTDRTITIDCVEDVFGLPVSSYGEAQPPMWVDPAQPAATITQFKVTEASYHEVVNQLSEPDLDVLAGNETFVVAMAKKAGANSGFTAWLAPADDPDTAALYGASFNTPTAVLAADVLQLETLLSYSALTGAIIEEVIPGHAYLDDELIWIEDIDPDAETMTVRRGIHDTVPVTHTAGAVFWFWNGDTGENGVLNFVGGQVEGEQVFVFLPGKSLGDVEALADEAHTDYTGVARWNTPWPPADVKINDSYFPTLVEGDLELSWVGRNKLQQTTEGEAGAIGWTEGSITPEVGATYTLLLKDGETDVLLDTIDGLVLGDSPYTVVDPTSYGSSLLKLEFFSELDGRESYQRFIHIVALSGLRETEDGDFRETEDGDEREIEF
ncbi:MAG: phage tail protein [Pseudomonadota bacterium]